MFGKIFLKSKFSSACRWVFLKTNDKNDLCKKLSGSLKRRLNS